MIVFYSHLSWFIFLASSFMVSALMSLFVLHSNEALCLSVILFELSNFPFTVSFYLDWMSMSFITVVLLISSVIIVYSYNYMSPYSNAPYFLWITVLFITSMLVVVTMSNLFFLMLGWDGLGLVSFFLIVYYQNSSSISSGVFTLLINRIGDCFFLVTIAIFFYYYPSLFAWSSSLAPVSVSCLLLVTFMTNSAIYPFSPWLPLAMAAPTPISALVHSSTLVTAGLYLMMRYSYLLYSSYLVINVLLVFSLFTSFYAGMNALFEVDLNNLIALSTLSHLGFIGLAFSAGLIQLAFFHLISHALFKSLLFMTMGDIMINLNHSQDIRYLSAGISYTPASCLIMYISLFNLLGLPNLSGFFSNDLILEMINFSFLSGVSLFIMYFNVFFTFFYTFQLFFYSFQPNNVLPYQTFHGLSNLHILLICLIGVMTLLYGFYFLATLYGVVLFYPVPVLNKFFPPFLISFIFLLLFIFTRQINIRSSLLHYYFSNIMYLTNFMMSVCSNTYYSLIFSVVRSTELGSINYFINSYLSSSIAYQSFVITKLTSLPSISTLLVFITMIPFLYTFLLSNNIIYYMWLLPINSHMSSTLSPWFTYLFKWLFNLIYLIWFFA